MVKSVDNHGSEGGLIQNLLKDLGILLLLWAIAAVIDQTWLAMDHATPSWDPADHMIGALNYWWTLQPQHWLSGHIWDALWTLSSKYPPLLYVSTAPFLSLLGQGADQSITVNLLYTGILLGSAYGLGRVLFRAEVGLWAAGLCLVFPQFYSLRTGYYMDYPLTTLVTASTLVLTLWYQSHTPATRPSDTADFFQAQPLGHQWWFALIFGVTFGLALLMKQTAIFFLVVPLLWVGLPTFAVGFRQGQWSRFGQIFSGVTIAFLMIWPWSQTNWLFQISAAFNSNIRSAEIEGDPAWNTVGGWTYYWQQLPQTISYPILIVASVGLLIGLFRWLTHTIQPSSALPLSPARSSSQSFIWLVLFLLPTYTIWSAIANKDNRYIMPWLPWWSVLLAYGLLCFPKKWPWVKWMTLFVAIMVMGLNLFPIGGELGRTLANTLAPGAYKPPYWGDSWPHQDVIEEIISTQPYQMINVGVMPSTPEINEHNFTLEGNRHNFQVYARRVARDRDFLDRDQRSLSWFLSVTPPNLNHHEESSRQRQRQMLDNLKQSGNFMRHRVWDLPDGSRLLLFRRTVLPVEVAPLDNAVTDVLYNSEHLNTVLTLLGGASNQAAGQSATSVEIQPLKVQLDDITVPRTIPPGQPVPVTYKWSGSWSMLHDGVVLLTWQRVGSAITSVTLGKASGASDTQHWYHDHAIGLGTLYPQIIQANQVIAAPFPQDLNPLQPFTVTEHTSMLPPADLMPGRYGLHATYLNRVTGETYDLAIPDVNVTLTPQADVQNAPELDWVTQLRQAARQLPQGIDALNQVFEDLGQMNLYDPVQAYTSQAEVIFNARLQHQPDNVTDVYGLALAHALQQDVDGAIAALERATELDGDNPYVYAQLGFVKLYAWRPWAAQKALDRAIALDPTVPEIKTLNAVAALMRGNLWQAWHRAQS